MFKFLDKRTFQQINIDAEFDIEGIDVFRISRCLTDIYKLPATIIQYTRSDKEHHVIIPTTDEQHVKFVNRLTAKIDDGSNPKVARE